ncbi:MULTISPECIES: hypothetical protein [unclassified Cryobacterium]|uniref:hypothetical protein n=1 Tax=unclassified Cryobacterium TaxID=2649013 RepID=UPI001F5412EB|nr:MULTISPECIES: hypothetical protein [unclassified Cryobacterium]
MTEKALTAEPAEPGAAEPAAHGQIEGNPVPISQETIDRVLCDGGCRWVDCDRSPAWTEAHHINDWLTDSGDTNLAEEVLLCHPHHLLLHNQQWKITRTGTQHWLRPPVENDPEQTLIALPSKRVGL